MFSLNARGIIELDSLLLIIDTVLHNPPEKIDVEQLIFDTIKGGPKTKQEIIHHLQIDKSCWKKASAKLKKKELIYYQDHAWRLKDDP